MRAPAHMIRLVLRSGLVRPRRSCPRSVRADRWLPRQEHLDEVLSRAPQGDRHPALLRSERDLPLVKVEIDTPMERMMSPRIAGKKLVFAPILRAGVPSNERLNLLQREVGRADTAAPRRIPSSGNSSGRSIESLT